MASSFKKTRSNKPPKGRLPSTSITSQPVVQDSTSLTALTAFSPDGTLFALLTLAVDKHRLRVYDVHSGQSTAEHILDSGRVTSLTWAHLDLSNKPPEAMEDSPDSPNKTSRKRKGPGDDMESNGRSAVEVVALGLSDGTLSLFSPSHGRILRSLYTPSSSSGILAALVDPRHDHDTRIWTSSADGVIRLWNAVQNSVLGSWRTQDMVPYTTMAIRPRSTEEEMEGVEILAAHHSIRLLSINLERSLGPVLVSDKPEQVASFTGHASPIMDLQWDASQESPTRFLSMAQADRFIYIWQMPSLRSGKSTEGKIVASIPLDSDARCMALSCPAGSEHRASSPQTILVVSASGKICIFPIPVELASSSGPEKAHHRIPTLLPCSTILISPKKKSADVQIVAASFTAEAGRIRVARLVNGVRPLFEYVDYLDGSNNFIPEVNVTHDDSVLEVPDQPPIGVMNKRYAEPSSLAIRTGIELGYW